MGLSRKRTFNKQSAPYKIPKKVKVDNSGPPQQLKEAGQKEDGEEEEMMDIMLCTQARLNDVTYSVRDIPR